MGDFGNFAYVAGAVVVLLVWIFRSIDQAARLKMLDRKFLAACDAIEQIRKDVTVMRGDVK